MIYILPHFALSALQTSASEACPLQIPPPTSVTAFVLVFVRVPSPQVFEHSDQALQEAQVQSRSEIQKNIWYLRIYLTNENIPRSKPYIA